MSGCPRCGYRHPPDGICLELLTKENKMDVSISRAVARKLVDILEAPDGSHPDVAKAISELVDALDDAQGNTSSKVRIIEISVTGTDMDLPE